MEKLSKRCITAVCFCLLFAIWGVYGQPVNKDRIEDTLVTIDQRQKPLGVIFRVLMRDYDIPIGFEESSLDFAHNDFDFDVNVRRPTTHEVGRDTSFTVIVERVFTAKEHLITTQFKNAPLKTVLDSIVAQMPNYQWRTVHGIINVYPKLGRDPRFAELLDLNIQSFTAKRPSFGLFKLRLIHLREVAIFLRSANLQIDDEVISGMKEKADQKLDDDLIFANVTFLELLNKYAAKKGGGWILRSCKHLSTQQINELDLQI